MKQTLATLIVFGSAALGIGCERIERDGVNGTLRQAIVYGTDDRSEATPSHSNSLLVALIPRVELASGGDAGAAESFEHRHALCLGERFANQPAISHCTGVLLDSDLLLTAAHCLEAVASCRDYAYVQDYYAQGDAGVLGGDVAVRECDAPLLVHHTTILDDQRLDFSVLQLSAAATNVTKPELRRSPPVVGESVTTLGTSGGLPFKSTSGVVLAVRAQGDYFDFTGDLFAGGSGSPVFDEQGSLLGIHVRGEPDFEFTAEGCWRTRTVAEDGGAGSEQANTLASVLPELCELLPERAFCLPAAADPNPNVPDLDPVLDPDSPQVPKVRVDPGTYLRLAAPTEMAAANGLMPNDQAEAESSELPVGNVRVDRAGDGCSIAGSPQHRSLRGSPAWFGLLCLAVWLGRRQKVPAVPPRGSRQALVAPGGGTRHSPLD